MSMGSFIVESLSFDSCCSTTYEPSQQNKTNLLSKPGIDLSMATSVLKLNSFSGILLCYFVQLVKTKNCKICILSHYYLTLFS